MMFSELFKIMVNKVTFAGFRGAIAPIASPPLDLPLTECNTAARINSDKLTETNSYGFHKSVAQPKILFGRGQSMTSS